MKAIKKIIVYTALTSFLGGCASIGTLQKRLENRPKAGEECVAEKRKNAFDQHYLTLGIIDENEKYMVLQDAAPKIVYDKAPVQDYQPVEVLETWTSVPGIPGAVTSGIALGELEGMGTPGLYLLKQWQTQRDETTYDISEDETVQQSTPKDEIDEILERIATDPELIEKYKGFKENAQLN